MSQRRSHGDGSVFYSESEGCWITEVSVGYDENGKRRRKRRRSKTKTEANRKRRELQRLADDGAPIGKANMTVAQLLDFYVETVLGSENHEYNTTENYRWSIEGHLKPGLGRIRITALTATDVETFLGHRRDNAGLASSSLRRLRGHLSKALTEAQRRNWIHRNVAEIARVPNSHKRVRRSLTQEQATALLDAAKGERLEAAFVVALTRGLRPGELLGLRWEDLDLEGSPPTLSIRLAVKREKNKLRLGDPKTVDSKRDLVLPNSAVQALREHKRRQAVERMKNADIWQDLGLVFCTEVGTLIDPSNFRREFKKITRKAGLGDWAPYELRHSAVSLLAAAGVPIDQLADLAGHKDATTLLAHYRHHLGGPVDAGIEQADAIVAG